MKSTSFAKIFLLLFLFSAVIFPQVKNDHTLFQSSPIAALLNGVMNDNFTVGEITKHGDFGLGTFNGVDGEMIVLNGKVYRVDNTGKVSQPPKSEKTPFISVIYFHADTVIQLNKNLDFNEFDKYLDGKLQSKNLIYAVKITGEFKSVKTRSEAKQTVPYSNLAEVLKNQSVFNFKEIKGTMVGFRFPAYMNGVNIPGYHFHFLSDNKKSGGHTLDFVTDNVKVEIETVNKIEMNLPESKDFLETNFEKQPVPGL